MPFRSSATVVVTFAIALVMGLVWRDRAAEPAPVLALLSAPARSAVAPSTKPGSLVYPDADAGREVALDGLLGEFRSGPLGQEFVPREPVLYDADDAVARVPGLDRIRPVDTDARLPTDPMSVKTTLAGLANDLASCMDLRGRSGPVELQLRTTPAADRSQLEVLSIPDALDADVAVPCLTRVLRSVAFAPIPAPETFAYDPNANDPNPPGGLYDPQDEGF